MIPTPSIDEMLAQVVAREGPFVHLAADRGGSTNWGITASTLAAWRRKPVSDDDVKALTQAEALTIYRTLYFDRPGFAKLPRALQPLMLDFGVNSGPPLAVRALQECLGLTPDGALGPLTLAAVEHACFHDDASHLLTALSKWRVMMLTRLVRRDPMQLTFLAGWMSRTLSFIP